MPWVGPIYTLPAGYTATPSTTILSGTQHNTPLGDIQAAFNQVLKRDGTTPLTGPLAANSQKITGLAAGTVAGDALRFEQLPSAGSMTASALAVAQTYGVGVTGTGPLMANIDATNVASGFYRYDGTTTGTFPTGITAAGTGIVCLAREDATNAIMTLFPSGSRAYMRDLGAGVWFPWREIVTVPQGGALGDTLYRAASVYANLPAGVAGQVLTGGTAPSWGTPGALGAAQSLSGAGPFSFAVPTVAKRIKVMFPRGSLSGADSILIQLSSGGVYQTTNYSSWSNSDGSTTESGMRINVANNLYTFIGAMELELFSGNQWVQTHTGATPNAADDRVSGSGEVTLSGSIDGVRVTKTGADTFTGGSVAVRWM